MPKLHKKKLVKKKAPEPPVTHREEMDRKDVIVSVPITSNNDLKASWTPQQTPREPEQAMPPKWVYNDGQVSTQKGFNSAITERQSRRSESLMSLHPYRPLFDIITRNKENVRVPE